MEKINETPQTRREFGLRHREAELAHLRIIDRNADEVLSDLEEEYTK